MPTLTLPKLTAGGIPLDMNSDSFGFMRSSIGLIDDAQALRERMSEDGYLYLPGYFDPTDIMAARKIITDRLDALSLLDAGYPTDDAYISPHLSETVPPDLEKDNPPLKKLLYSGLMMEFYERFFGGEVRHFDFTWFRAATIGKNADPHCDIVFMGRGTFDVLTAWTPLGDIPLDNGVLMMLEGSHRKRMELKEYLSRDVDAYCISDPNADGIVDGHIGTGVDGHLSKNAADLRAKLGGRWLTTEFKMGDLLTFTMGTVHCSADNLTNKIRLSTDTRYQRASEPIDNRWIGEHPVGHGVGGKMGKIC